MLKGAIFDMDGLLFDTERIYRESWQVLSTSFGVTHNPAFVHAVCGTTGEIMSNVLQEYYPGVDADSYAEAVYNRVNEVTQASVPMMKGVTEILSYFKEQGFRIAVASGSPLSTIRHHLKVTEIDSYFDEIVSSVGIERGKPAPDVFLMAAKALKLPPEDCYVFEDGINGVNAGLAAGCKTIMIPGLTEPTPDLYERCHAVCLDLLVAMQRIAAGEI